MARRGFAVGAFATAEGSGASRSRNRAWACWPGGSGAGHPGWSEARRRSIYRRRSRI
ncbi:hypothetical protein HPP92_001217 [Vanilla planifolia]|uniref:Uncharacterized protein n=1 Tax=Vanilla planifolia TaxID=51239 RepID=A0A835VHC7_VANPL|nr:hypothetical protein HPP92_001217 [Vanilla planifolia]